MELITVRCRTNIDEYHHEEWPDVMCCRPIKGDTVAAKSGKKLAVVQVTHRLAKDGKPYLEIELHRGGPL